MPADPTAGGQLFVVRSLRFDAGANPLGATTSNRGIAVVDA